MKAISSIADWFDTLLDRTANFGDSHVIVGAILTVLVFIIVVTIVAPPVLLSRPISKWGRSKKVGYYCFYRKDGSDYNGHIKEFRITKDWSDEFLVISRQGESWVVCDDIDKLCKDHRKCDKCKQKFLCWTVGGESK